MTDSRKSGRYLAPALVACAVATGASATELTIDRLFDAPPLAGPTIVGLKISPDGLRVSYLKGKADDKDRLDLWGYKIHEPQTPAFVGSKDPPPKQEKVSDEGMSRSARQR